MKRSVLNFIVDALAFVALVALITTGLVMRFVLPPLRRGDEGKLPHTLLWEMDRHQWGEIHFWIAVGLLTILAIHLFLHWKWIVSVVQGKPGEGSGIRATLGIISLAVLLVLAMLPFLSPREFKTHSGKSSILKNNQTFPGKHGKNSEVREKSYENSGLERKVPSEKSSSGKDHVPRIRGGMTLQDVEDTTGVPIHYILETLGLPEDTPPEQRLGRLRKQYGFDIQDVRNTIKGYKP